MPLRLKMAPDPSWGPTCSSTTMVLGADLSPGWLVRRLLLGCPPRPSGKLWTAENHLFHISRQINTCLCLASSSSRITCILDTIQRR
jgi:hypothetical protein